MNDHVRPRLKISVLPEIFWAKVAKFLIKVAKFLKNPKDLHQRSFKSQKIYIKGLWKVKNIYIKAQKIMVKTCLNLFFAKFWKVSQKVAKFQSSEHQKKVSKGIKK